MAIQFGGDIGEILGTKRFGQQSMQQGQSLSNMLASGFIRRAQKQEEEEQRQREFNSNIFGLLGAGAGAMLGGQFGASDIGASFGRAAGEAVGGDIKSSSLDNIVNSISTNQQIGDQAKVNLISKGYDVKDQPTEGYQEVQAGGRRLFARKQVNPFEKFETINNLISKGFDIRDSEAEGYQEVKLSDGTSKYAKKIEKEGKSPEEIRLEQKNSYIKSGFTVLEADELQNNPDRDLYQEVNVSGSDPFYVKKTTEKTTSEIEKDERDKLIIDVQERARNDLMNDKRLNALRDYENVMSSFGGAIKKNDPSLYGALKSRLARILAGEKGVLTDKDVQRVEGSMAFIDRVARAGKKFLTGKMLDRDVNAFISEINRQRKENGNFINSRVEEILEGHQAASGVKFEDKGFVDFTKKFYFNNIDNKNNERNANTNIDNKDEKIKRLRDIVNLSNNQEDVKRAKEILRKLGADLNPSNINPRGL